MRQLEDLLVWFLLVAVLLGVVYFTPKIAQYTWSEFRPMRKTAFDSSVTLHILALPDQSE
jgi:hypothetical protein